MMKFDVKTTIGGVVLVLIVGYSVYLNRESDRILSQDGRYTVGTTLRYVISPNGREVVYEFQVLGQTFQAFAGNFDGPKVPGGRYLVKFSSSDPNVCEIFFTQPIPLSIIPPNNGWGSIREINEQIENGI